MWPLLGFLRSGLDPRFWDPARRRGPTIFGDGRLRRQPRQSDITPRGGGGISRWMGTGAWMSMVGPQWNFSTCAHQVGGVSLQRSGPGRDGTKTGPGGPRGLVWEAVTGGPASAPQSVRSPDKLLTVFEFRIFVVGCDRVFQRPLLVPKRTAPMSIYVKRARSPSFAGCTVASRAHGKAPDGGPKRPLLGPGGANSGTVLSFWSHPGPAQISATRHRRLGEHLWKSSTGVPPSTSRHQFPSSVRFPPPAP
jgi:hypothetical protein